jgi:outer membrane protein insertion porin family
MLLRHLPLLLCLLASAAAGLPVRAQEDSAGGSFVIEDIQVRGLRRISPGAVFIAMPVRVGDVLDEARSGEIVRALFQTGFFSDVRLDREGSVLVVAVEERPSIGEINLSGNKDIKTEDLLKALRSIDLAPGRIFVPSALDQVQQELQRQYYAQGKYGVEINTEIKDLPRNRVAINIALVEGDVARIRSINIIGNEIFDDDTLRAGFKLSTPNLLSFITGNDKYSRQKLAGDLETLQSFYFDRGYLDFRIESTQVSITPDKSEMYITVNVTEGQRYTVEEVKLSGNLVIAPEEMVQLVALRPGETFSRRRVTQTSEAVSARLGDEGYAFANVNAVPEVDAKNGRVKVVFFVDPGKRAYVRRITFAGNDKTLDPVLRREMRQMEAASFSAAAVERSRVRLERLGFFEEVSVETPAVPGSPDLVDVAFTVKERPSGTISAGAGFGQDSGFLLNAAITQENFLGTGDAVSVNFSQSDYSRIYSVSHTDPYATVDGIARTVSAYMRSTDASDANLTDFDTRSYGANIGFNVPISEFNSFGAGIGYDSTKIDTGFFTAQEILDFLDDNGGKFDSVRTNFSIANDTRNKRIFPDRGGLQRLAAEVALPLGDLQFYKLTYTWQRLFPFTETTTLQLGSNLGYGDSYGDTTELPFFENFFAGGFRSVRGYENNSLGPRASDDDPFGGNKLITGRAELFFPVPFLEQQSGNFRMSAFFDAGNVFGPGEAVKVGDLRASTGVAAVWISPFGAITVSFAQPFNDGPDDEIERFQFNLGANF